MFLKLFVVLAGVAGGIGIAYYLITQTGFLSYDIKRSFISQVGEKKESVDKTNTKVVIGFLPFWLIDKAQADYSPYITQLSYFNVVIDEDGSVQKFTAPGESDPGWHAINSGRVDTYLFAAKSRGLDLSLTVFSGNDKKINSFLSDPVTSAENLVNDINPLITKFGFADINLDIEKVGKATEEQRAMYTNFVSEVRKRIDPKITITVDLQSIAFVKDDNLTDPKGLSQYADYLVIMGYDFHNIGSFVTGPVAPQNGAGIVSEFDIESVVEAAQAVVPSEKLILAIPLYGYSWESINPGIRSATLPSSGYSISNRAIEELLATCATCSAKFDEVDKENYIVYKNDETGLYHQIFYPDKTSTQAKVDFAKSRSLGGMALWALGYEGESILQPLSGYRH